MTKELVTIEFRYLGPKRGEWDSNHKTKTITIGIFDSFEEACEKGNETLKILEKNFKKHVFPSGVEADSQRFSKNGGCFGDEKRLITNLAYLKTPFEFYSKITKLKLDSVVDSIEDVLNSVREYQEFRKQEQCQ